MLTTDCVNRTQIDEQSYDANATNAKGLPDGSPCMHCCVRERYASTVSSTYSTGSTLTLYAFLLLCWNCTTPSTRE